MKFRVKRKAPAVINELMTVIANFDREGITTYLDEWRSYDYMRGNEVTIHIGNQQFSGVVQGVDENGMLLLRHNNGKTKAYASGEVSFSATEK